MKICLKLTLYAVLSISLFSCVHITEIGSSYLPDDTFPKLNANHSIKIVNSSLSKDDIKVASSIGNKWMGNLYEYSETAVDVVQNALQRRNVMIEDGSAKTINLSVIKAYCPIVSCIVKLRVSLGNGIEEEYKGERVLWSGHDIPHQLEKSLAIAVQNMLNDEKIIKYLEH